MNHTDSYTQHVRPQVTPAPTITLTARDGWVALASVPVVMLVGMTGSGKSTTLAALVAQGNFSESDTIPSRRSLTDQFIIPLAQHTLNEPIAPVKDRAERFRLTRAFREQVMAGGAAEAFGQLYIPIPTHTPLSEGVRGVDEIRWALAYSQWRIVELAVEPLERLRRLSQRDDPFDQISADSISWDFLPESQRDLAREQLQRGAIHPKAVAIVQAEAQNYGDTRGQIAPHPRYLRLQTDDLTPSQVAEQVLQFVG